MSAEGRDMSDDVGACPNGGRAPCMDDMCNSGDYTLCGIYVADFLAGVFDLDERWDET